MGKIDTGIIYGKLYNSQTRTFLIRTGEKFIDETGLCAQLNQTFMNVQWGRSRMLDGVKAVASLLCFNAKAI